MTEAVNDYLAIVRSAIAGAVGVEEDEVQPEASILGDLGAESIDLLDALFRIEQVAGVKIQASEIADQLQGGLSDEEFEGPGGIITAWPVPTVTRSPSSWMAAPAAHSRT